MLIFRPGEGDHVDRQLPEVSIELAGESEAGRHAGHGEGDEMVEVSVRRSRELQCPEANVVESLVVNDVSLVSVLHKLVEGEGGIVRLHHRVTHLGGRHHRKCVHDLVWVFLSVEGQSEGYIRKHDK